MRSSMRLAAAIGGLWLAWCCPLAAAPAPKAEPDITIQGQAVTADGAPVAGVPVRLFGQVKMKSSTYAAQSDADGRFSVKIPAEAATALRLDVDSPAGSDLRPVAVEGLVTNISEFNPPQPVKILMVKGTARLAGRVTTEDGKGVAGAKVTIRLGAFASFFHTQAITKDDGSYEFTNLAPGVYTVPAVVPPDGMDLIRLESWKNVRSFAVREAQSRQEDFRLAKSGKFTGKVLDDAGKPLAGAKVACSLDVANEDGPKYLSALAGQWFGASAVTDAKGQYVLTGMSPETYIVEVAPPEGGNLAPTQVRGQILKGTETVPVQDVTLSPAGALTVKVLGPDGKGTVGVKLTLITMPLRMFAESGPSAYTDVDGKAVFMNLASGRYRLDLEPPVNTGLSAQSIDDIGVLAGLHLAQTVKIADGWSISGVVRDSAGQAVPNVAINMSRTYRNYAATSTDSAGKFKIVGLPLGADKFDAKAKWRISATPGSEIPELDSVSKELASNDKDMIVDLVLPEAAVISGIVTLPDGKPAAAVVVMPFQAQGNGATFGRPARTGPNGKYVLGQIGAGKWEVAAVPVAGGDLVAATGVANVKPGAPAELNLSLKKGLTLTGKVVGPGGKPGPITEIQINFQGNMPPYKMLTSSQNVVTHSAADGTFQAVGLLPGKYVLQSRPLDGAHRIDPQPIELTASRDVQLVAQLTGMLAGRLVDPAGKDLTGFIVDVIKDSKPSNSMYPDRQGLFHDDAMMPGKYTLKARPMRDPKSPGVTVDVTIESGRQAQVEIKIETPATTSAPAETIPDGSKP